MSSISCIVCNMIFENIKEKNQHTATSDGCKIYYDKNILKCDKCDKIYNNKSSFCSHYYRIHLDKVNKKPEKIYKQKLQTNTSNIIIDIDDKKDKTDGYIIDKLNIDKYNNSDDNDNSSIISVSNEGDINNPYNMINNNHENKQIHDLSHGSESGQINISSLMERTIILSDTKQSYDNSMLKIYQSISPQLNELGQNSTEQEEIDNITKNETQFKSRQIKNNDINHSNNILDIIQDDHIKNICNSYKSKYNNDMLFIIYKIDHYVTKLKSEHQTEIVRLKNELDILNSKIEYFRSNSNHFQEQCNRLIKK